MRLYDALKEAGASEEKARAAAASLTGRDQGRDQSDQRFDRVRAAGTTMSDAVPILSSRRSRPWPGELARSKNASPFEQKVITIAQDVAVLKAEFGSHEVDAGITIGGSAPRSSVNALLGEATRLNPYARMQDLTL